MEQNISVTLTQVQGFEFVADFGKGLPQWTLDEPAPMGQNKGPNPVQLLAAAIGNCLSDSLFFALRKFKHDPSPIKTQVIAVPGRNKKGRIRILKLEVRITLGQPASSMPWLNRALSQFEEFCTVAESVRGSLPVHIEVIDSEGKPVKF